MVSVCLPSDALWQHLPSYLGFSYPGRGVSLHGCSSKAQPLLLTLDEGYLIQKRCPFHYKGLECKSRKSRNTWSNRQIWPWIQNEAGQRLIEFCQKNALVIPNTLFQQHKRRLYTWTSPDGQHWNQIDYTLVAKDGEALYSQQKQDQELTVAQIMNSLLPNSDLNWRK